MGTLNWRPMHEFLDNLQEELRISRQAAARYEDVVSRMDEQDRKIHTQSERIAALENRLRQREKAHKQQHRLIHKLIQQIKGLEDEIYVSTDGTPPSNGHSRDGNDSEEAVDALLREDPTVNSPSASPRVPPPSLPSLSEHSRPSSAARSSRATVQPSGSTGKASLAPSVSPQSVRTTSSDEATLQRLQEELGMTPSRRIYPALGGPPSATPVARRTEDAPPSRTNIARQDIPSTIGTPTASRPKSVDTRGRDANILRSIENDRRAAAGTFTTVRAAESDRTDVDRSPSRATRDTSRADVDDTTSISIESTSVSHYSTATDDSARNQLNAPATSRTRLRPPLLTRHHVPSPALQPYPKIRPPKAPSSISSTSSIGIPGSYPRATSQGQFNIPPPIKAASLPPTADLEEEFNSSQETVQPTYQPSRVSTQVTKKSAVGRRSAKPPSINLTATQKSTLETIEKLERDDEARFLNLAEEMGRYENQDLRLLDSDIDVLIKNHLIMRVDEEDEDENWLLRTNPSTRGSFIVA